MNRLAWLLTVAGAAWVLSATAAPPQSTYGFRGTWSRIVDPVSGTTSWVGRSARALGPAQLRPAVAEAFKLPIADVSEGKAQQCAAGKQVAFHQLFRGYEIGNAGVLLHLDTNNAITYFRPEIAKPPDEETPPPVPDQAKAFVLRSVRGALGGDDSPQIDVRSVSGPALYAVAGRARWAISGRLEVRRPGEHAARVVDVVVGLPSGEVLAIYDRAHGQSDPLANVFFPTPLTKCTADEYNEVAPQAPYREVPLANLDPNSKVARGKWAEFADLDSQPNGTWACDGNGKCDFHFSWLSDRQAFSEVMTYYLINVVQQHVEDLGFTNLANHRIQVDVVADLGQYRAEYENLPIGNGNLLFGFENGHSVADDGKVVVHEYGHALQAAAVGGNLDKEGEPAALQEGFADYMALSTFAADESDDCRTCIGAFMNDGMCIRDLKNNATLTYNLKKPDTNPTDAYELGSIWTRALWNSLTTLALQKSLGWKKARDVADRAALLGNCYIGAAADAMTLPKAATATLAAVHDDAVTKAYFDVFCSAFVALNLVDNAQCQQILNPSYTVN